MCAGCGGGSLPRTRAPWRTPLDLRATLVWTISTPVGPLSIPFCLLFFCTFLYLLLTNTHTHTHTHIHIHIQTHICIHPPHTHPNTHLYISVYTHTHIYTGTVYVKGAEVVRMYRTLLGEQGAWGGDIVFVKGGARGGYRDGDGGDRV